MSETPTAESDAPRRRTESEARRCSQEGCPGDGRYQPPGKGHLLGCQHNAVAWVWETVTPPAEKDRPRATVTQAVAAWEAKGPTSLTVALMAEALYGVHDAFSEFAGKHSAALHTIAQDPRDPDFADDWCALAALATTVQTRVLPSGVGA